MPRKRHDKINMLPSKGTPDAKLIPFLDDMAKMLSNAAVRQMNIENRMPDGPESQRLRFLISRDGVDGAVAFALQTLRIYRQSVLKNGRHNRQFHFASTREYRRKFIEAYCHFKRFYFFAQAGMSDG